MITIGWRQGPDGIEEQAFNGPDLPEGWFDNPQLRPNTESWKRNGLPQPEGEGVPRETPEPEVSVEVEASGDESDDSEAGDD